MKLSFCHSIILTTIILTFSNLQTLFIEQNFVFRTLIFLISADEKDENGFLNVVQYQPMLDETNRQTVFQEISGHQRPKFDSVNGYLSLK
ncbi:MAG: hypothetical protein ACE5IR_17635 [bacterium]